VTGDGATRVICFSAFEEFLNQVLLVFVFTCCLRIQRQGMYVYVVCLFPHLERSLLFFLTELIDYDT
jgi:hypothetical protein